MSRQKARIEALEKRMPLEVTKLPLLLIKFCQGGHGKPIVARIGMADVIGVGRIKPHEGETEASFVRRAYAMHAAQRPLEEMTDEELEVALAAADEAIAMEKVKEGRLGDDTFQSVSVIDRFADPEA
jgi:hypothetical protein